MVLHSGPSEEAPPLASVSVHQWGGGMDINLPPAQPQGSTQEAVVGSGWLNRSHTFSIETQGPKGLAREEFSWAHKRGGALSRLGGAGWQLTRASTGEIVAVWAFAGMSMTKRFQFEFLGSAVGGMLGERFDVMTVISAIGMFERERRRKNNGAVGGASAIAGAAS